MSEACRGFPFTEYGIIIKREREEEKPSDLSLAHLANPESGTREQPDRAQPGNGPLEWSSPPPVVNDTCPRASAWPTRGTWGAADDEGFAGSEGIRAMSCAAQALLFPVMQQGGKVQDRNTRRVRLVPRPIPLPLQKEFNCIVL